MPNEPVPVFRSSDRLLVTPLAIARSGLPLRSKSPSATDCGPSPVANAAGASSLPTGAVCRAPDASSSRTT